MEQEDKIAIIEQVVCKGFGMDRKTLFKRRRTMLLSDARAFLFYCLKEKLGMRVYHMEKRYGYDHSTIFYHIDNVKYNMRMYSDYKEKANQMLDKIDEML